MLRSPLFLWWSCGCRRYSMLEPFFSFRTKQRSIEPEDKQQSTICISSSSSSWEIRFRWYYSRPKKHFLSLVFFLLLDKSFFEIWCICDLLGKWPILSLSLAVRQVFSLNQIEPFRKPARERWNRSIEAVALAVAMWTFQQSFNCHRIRTMKEFFKESQEENSKFFHFVGKLSSGHQSVETMSSVQRAFERV